MRLRNAYKGWYDEDLEDYVSAVAARKAEKALAIDCASNVFSAIEVYVNQAITSAYDTGLEEGSQINQPDPDVPSFQSMVSLQIEKIKAAKTIVRSMDGIKESCARRGLDVEFSESMASAYETALKFLEEQMKGDGDSALEEENQKLKEIRSALNEYHKRLKNREHGGVAQDSFVKTCEKILGMND